MDYFLNNKDRTIWSIEYDNGGAEKIFAAELRSALQLANTESEPQKQE